MNNKPVAWMCQDNVTDEWEFSSMKHCHKCEPLYTHPVKELKNIVLASATCSCGKVMEVTNLQPVKELTAEEITELTPWNKYPYESFVEYTIDDLIDFARAILRKASEK